VRYLKPPWAAEHRALETRFSPEECRLLLEPHVASGFAFWTDRPVRGSARSGGFSLTKSISYRNSFQTQAAGKFVRTDAGTHIRVRLGLSRPVAALFTFWLLGLTAFAALGFLMLVADLPRSLNTANLSSPVRLVAVVGGMLTFGVALQTFGRWLARDEADFLMRFLGETLEAQELPETQ
jgi:hypothetical protein